MLETIATKANIANTIITETPFSVQAFTMNYETETPDAPITITKPRAITLT